MPCPSLGLTFQTHRESFSQKSQNFGIPQLSSNTRQPECVCVKTEKYNHCVVMCKIAFAMVAMVLYSVIKIHVCLLLTASVYL